jgi:hypothetical protein
MNVARRVARGGISWRALFPPEEWAMMPRAYDEVVDFIAAGPSSGSVVAFRPSGETRCRVADLVRREKTGDLSPEEVSELEHSLRLEHLMRLARARARQYLDP